MYSTIEEHIQCSICLSAIRGAVLTPCGHRYCTRCITEWVSRNHTCPCCNSSLNSGQFYFDVQFDGLVDVVLSERDKAEEEYYTKIFGNGPADQPTFGRKSSAFEDILKKHMKESMLSHQRYFENLHGEYRRKIRLLENGITSGTSLESSLPRDASVEAIKEELTQNLQDSERLAAESFDKYLKDNVPSLEAVPVTVSVYIADKDVRVDGVVISPSDSLSVIKPIIEAHMRQRANDIQCWTDNGGIKLLFGPLLKSKKYNVEEAARNLGQSDSIRPLQWDSKLIFQHSMRPGSEIVLHKVFQSLSDLPKQCFADVYIPDTPQRCDYFICNKCNVKWICKSCIQSCHEGHSISPFAMNHCPTWACCYCPKKKLCRIQTASMAVGGSQSVYHES
ncbi:uncharacterized protein LOC101855943 isoform X2 [Aplysia californica]|uniref:Uncharacterized protein LOC101855943 isoform X2 n=1 Tax=Aplysia californica TaxID=6500 RepID=A0ABM0JMY3_APLCA|nr:uncharacterized protein LOC101855943 isoform X2 [Aplysia californica]